ncbi:insulin-like growth factor-binding protein-related protein 1 [Thrips palmi]|uniref:Insulin-like growth factor-binding protein-related protein 1 n=1 Tax=Thrips palmi TaxID=161013 RepID=A0A6P8ZIR8_THRPL|nr:insulin-like growth factor-binding protein-related protein 1 [Thrips palmi]
MECAAGVGLAPDPCGCCADGVCGLPEGSRCYNASSDAVDDLALRALGVCGDNMDCIKRTDLREEDKPEALCVCRDPGQVCGSDNTTYASTCLMKSARPASADEAPVKVWLKHRGPCRSAPWIVTAPTSVSYVAGSPVSLECEVKGYPGPTASWERIKDGIATPLPGDDASLVVMLRGGPEPFMATTWLQIMTLREADVGTYICVATNSEGVARVGTNVAIAAEEDVVRP